MTGLGTWLAPLTGSNSVAPLVDKFNVRFRASKLRNWLALADHYAKTPVEKLCIGMRGNALARR